MRFTLATALFAGVLSASAATLQARQASFPSCAITCVTNPSNLFGCDASDNTCLCNSQQYVAETTQCIVNGCDASDAASAEALSRQLCAAVGVTLTATPSLTPSGSSAAPTGSGSSTPAVTSSSSSPASPSATTQTTSGAMSNGINALVGVGAVVLATVFAL